MQTATSVKALVFDVFGTVVDWRSTIVHEGQQWNQRKNWTVDWARFADRWRAGYAPAMNRVRTGELPWKKIDELHRLVLEDVLAEFRLTLSEAEKGQLNRVWHRLEPWPDSVAGLTRLKRRYVIATLSNGNVSLLVDMAKHAGLPWDAVLSAELAGHYKPDPEVYLTAARLLDCAPGEVMMVAAHRNDLDAAARLGLRTAFVHRPLEYGAGGKADSARPRDYDFVARDLLNLATQTGA